MEELLIIESPLTTLADGLLSAGCIKFGEFTLKSGLTISHLYRSAPDHHLSQTAGTDRHRPIYPVLTNLNSAALLACPMLLSPLRLPSASQEITR